MTHVLIVDDDAGSRLALEELVKGEGFVTATAGSLDEARRSTSANPPALILADLRLPDGEGTELLRTENGESRDLVLITGHASLETAVEALRLGAIDYLTKPIEVARLRTLLASFKRTQELQEEVSQLRASLKGSGRFGEMVGSAPAVQEVYELIEKVAPTDATVLITGESGTGKEVVAQTLHSMSPRHGRPLVPLNCGAVSPNLIESELFGHERGSFTGAERRHQGVFERADGGSLFLDEVTEMPIELQVKLLRVLETGEVTRVGGVKATSVDARVIAASNRDPHQAVAEGRLREDLYYRLRVFPIHLPPLRERGNDIELLARHFLDGHNRTYGTAKRISDEAVEQLLAYSWPGNVRELKNIVQRAFILAEDRITPESLPPEVRMNLEVPRSGPYLQVRVGNSIAEVEKRLILATLDDCHGKRKEAAEALGVSLKTLYNRLKSYGM